MSQGASNILPNLRYRLCYRLRIFLGTLAGVVGIAALLGFLGVI